MPTTEDYVYDYMNYLWYIDGHKTMNRFSSVTEALTEIITNLPKIDKPRSYVLSFTSPDVSKDKFNIDQFIEYCTRWHDAHDIVQQKSPYYNPTKGDVA